MHYQLSSVSGKIMETYSMTPAMFSRVFSAPMIPAVLFSLISGIMADRYEAKPVISISLAATVAGGVLRCFSSSFPSLFVSMILIGVAAAVLNANGVKVLSGSIPRERTSFFTGIMLASATFAMTLGTGTTSFFPSLRAVFITGMIVGVAALILWLLLADNTAPKHETGINTFDRSSVRAVMRCPIVWMAGISMFFITSCLLGITSFLPMALAKRGMDTVVAGYYTAVFTAENLVGSFSSPAIDQFWKHTKAQLVVMTVLIGIGTAFAWLVPSGVLLTTVLLITGICIGGIFPLLMPLPLRFGGISPDQAGVAGGVVSTLQLAGAIILPSYIAAPIAGDDLGLFFRIVGGLMIVPFAMCIIMKLD